MPIGGGPISGAPISGSTNNAVVVVVFITLVDHWAGVLEIEAEVYQ